VGCNLWVSRSIEILLDEIFAAISFCFSSSFSAASSGVSPSSSTLEEYSTSLLVQQGCCRCAVGVWSADEADEEEKARECRAGSIRLETECEPGTSSVERALNLIFCDHSSRLLESTMEEMAKEPNEKGKGLRGVDLDS